MARLDQGLLGGYSGRLGTTVGATWKGINVVRTYQPNVANPRTQAQTDQRQLFRDVVQFGSFYLADVIKPFWDRGAKRMSGYNAFVSANTLAMKPFGGFDPELLIIGDGRMGSPVLEYLITPSGGYVSVDWSEAGPVMYGKETDRLYMFIFNFAGEVIGSSLGEGTRRDETRSILTTEGPDLEEAIIVTAWLSEDGLLQSITSAARVVKPEG